MSRPHQSKYSQRQCSLQKPSVDVSSPHSSSNFNQTCPTYILCAPSDQLKIEQLFEVAWTRSTKEVKSQLLKLYVTWKSTLSPEIIKAIDHNMTAASQRKRPNHAIPQSTPAKIPRKDIPPKDNEPSLTPTPMRSNNPPYWSINHDPNVIEIESEDSDSDDRQGEEIGAISLAELMMEAAEKCRPAETDTSAQPVVPGGGIDFRHLNVFNGNVYSILVQGSKTTKPRYLDWRFKLRFERRNQNCQSRSWYAHPENWAQDSDPKELSPQQFLQKLSKPRMRKAEDIKKVLIDDNNPQTRCGISGDRLEKKFDEETGSWSYLNCKRLFKEEAKANGVPDGTVCLLDCIKPFLRI